MSAAKYGYLAKLRAVSEIRAPANAMNIARFLDVGYETARSSLRRLEKAGYIKGARRDSNRWRTEVAFELTEAGAEALARGVELTIPTADPTPRTQGAATNSEPPETLWQELHEALRMGQPVKPPRARVVDLGMDREPVGWRLRA